MQQTDPVDHETREIDEVIQRLQDRFPDLSVERIREAVTDAHRDFEGRPIRDFVPVFVERTARVSLVTPSGRPNNAVTPADH